MKKEDKLSRTRPDKNEKKNWGRGVLGLEHFISLSLGLEHFISLSHPSPKLFFHFCPDASETFSLPFLLGFQLQNLMKSKKI